MPSSKGFSIDWLKEKGLVETSPGVYEHGSKEIVKIAGGKELIIDTAKQPIPTLDFTHIPSLEWFIRGYNVPSKKNSRQNFVGKDGKQISIPSKIHAEFVKMTKMQFETFGKEFRSAIMYYGLEYPLSVEFTFIRSSRRRFDYCNACQTAEDLMVKYEWIKDDSADHLIPVFKKYEYDKALPGVKIKLLLK